MKTTLDMVKNVHHHELRQVAKIQEVLLKIFNSHGCKMVETPTFEPYDSYSGYFPHLRKQFIKTIDTDGSVLVLRPDVTIPLVKSLAREYSDSQAYLKFSYITNVFLNYQGRHRGGKDFLQGGAEILGSAEVDCDSEIIFMAMEALRSLNIKTLHVDIGTVAYSNAFYEDLILPEEDLARLKSAVEERNMDKLGDLCKELSIESADREFIMALPTLFGPYEDTMDQAKKLCRNVKMVRALERLEEVVDQLLWQESSEIFFLDFAFSNRLNYYTDMMFKIYADGAPYTLVDGGRYDTMSSQFGVDRPACGFGININLLYEYISENLLIEDLRPNFDLLIRYTSITKNLFDDISSFREKGMKVAALPAYGKTEEGDYALVVEYKKGAYIHKGTSYDSDGLFRVWEEEMM